MRIAGVRRAAGPDMRKDGLAGLRLRPPAQSRLKARKLFGDNASVNISTVAAGFPLGQCPLRPEFEAARRATDDGAATIGRAVRCWTLGIRKKQKTAAKPRGRAAFLRDVPGQRVSNLGRAGSNGDRATESRHRSLIRWSVGSGPKMNIRPAVPVHYRNVPLG